jgi:hypothetical protein
MGKDWASRQTSGNSLRSQQKPDLRISQTKVSTFLTISEICDAQLKAFLNKLVILGGREFASM